MVTSLSRAGRAFLPDYSEPIPVTLKCGWGHQRELRRLKAIYASLCSAQRSQDVGGTVRPEKQLHKRASPNPDVDGILDAPRILGRLARVEATRIATHRVLFAIVVKDQRGARGGPHFEL